MPRLLVDLAPLEASPAYRRLWLGNALAFVGTQLTLVAVSLEVFALTGSSFAVGMLGLAALIPLVVAGLYGGAVADRHDRRTVALASGAVMWAATALIAAHAWAGVESVGVLYGLVALHSAASGINQPTRGAIIPALVGPALLPAANALNMLTFSTAMMAGPLLGGVLVATMLSYWIGLTWWSLGAAVAISLVLGKVLRLGEQAIEMPISAMLILAVSDPAIAAETRVLTTLIGAGVGIGLNLLYPPAR